MGLLKKLFGTSSEKELRAIKPIVDKIEALDGEYSKLTDEQLRAKTAEFKQRVADGESLDDILPEAFAACREAAWRVLGMKPYRVQLIGGIILHQGRIAEMKTGEGKTLVATLPAYLNALAGEGVHIVTVNDYLAKRDSEWMGKVYRFMGLTVGLVIHDVPPRERKAAYDADITYGTNNEFGFDYLRDNMAIYKQEMVQRGHSFAIVDEVDSILIDEARTPLIISGQGEKSTQLYTVVDQFVSKLTCQRIDGLAGRAIHDAALARMRDHIVAHPRGLGFVAHLLAAKVEVLAIEARHHRRGVLQAEHLLDVRTHALGCRSGKGRHNGTLRKRFDELANLQVGGAKILAPLAHAVRLVNGHERHADAAVGRGLLCKG